MKSVLCRKAEGFFCVRNFFLRLKMKNKVYNYAEMSYSKYVSERKSREKGWFMHGENAV